MSNELPPLPEGFKLISGTRSPPKGDDARYYIMLRCGFVTKDTYAPDQLKWIHGNHSGDVIAVKRDKGSKHGTG